MGTFCCGDFCYLVAFSAAHAPKFKIQKGFFIAMPWDFFPPLPRSLALTRFF